MRKAETTREIPGSNGVMRLNKRMLGLIPSVLVYGGPFRYCPDRMLGVCLLEAPGDMLDPTDVHCPIRDFSVPTDDTQVRHALQHALLWGMAGKSFYVGCQGGWGRTGLFLALLAKVNGQADPIGFVRDLYSSHAVETAQQEAYVRDFDVRPIQKWMKTRAVTSWARRMLGMEPNFSI